MLAIRKKVVKYLPMNWFKRKRSTITGLPTIAEIARICRHKGFYIPDRDGDGTAESPFSEKTMSGPLDEVNTGLCYRRLQVARLTQALFPGYSFCGRCQMPWALVREHTTWISPARGMFPLCEDCWRELQNPMNRLPYYRDLFDGYMRASSAVRESEWGVIESAVFQEAIPELKFHSSRNVN